MLFFAFAAATFNHVGQYFLKLLAIHGCLSSPCMQREPETYVPGFQPTPPSGWNFSRASLLQRSAA
jgi:hypothetical protein